MKKSLMYVISLGVLFSCEPYNDSDSLLNDDISAIKSITSTFISHQSDTDDKDNRTIAVASFYADGSLNQFHQHLTYPYNLSKPTERDFWQNPLANNIPHIMDGLELGFAEKNLLYGNDWSIAYANMIKDEGHPNYARAGELFKGVSTQFELNNDNMPTLLNTKVPSGRDNYLVGTLEKFEYIDQKVRKYSTKNVFDIRMRGKLIKSMPDSIKKNVKNLDFFNDTFFSYENDKIVEVIDKRNTYKFIYDVDKLVKSEFYIGDKLMNRRVFYYLENGLKEKTEIFNVDNQLEYTIEYDYEFFSS